MFKKLFNHIFPLSVCMGCLFFLCGMSSVCHAEKKPQIQPLYMFGFAGSFVDSVAYLTNVSKVDSSWIDAHKFLIDRTLYSMQLQLYVEKKGCSHPVCCVIFDKNAKKAKKVWKKVRKRYLKAKDLTFKEIPLSDFHFTAEEYRPIVMDIDANANVDKKKSPKNTPNIQNTPNNPSRADKKK